MARSATRRASCKRNQRGGGAGGGMGFSDPSAWMKTISNPIAGSEIGNCRAPDAPRPGYIENGYELLKGGLPGMRGGRKRRGRGSRKGKGKGKARRTQRGGRYGFDITAAPPGGTPWGTNGLPVSAIGCETSRSLIPDSSAAGNLNKVAGALWDGPKTSELLAQRGGGQVMAPAPLSTPVQGSADSQFLTVPTARYSVNEGSPIPTAAGTYLAINKPISYAEMNAACVKTGGSRKLRGVRKSKKSKKSRRVRKGSKRH